MKSLMRFRYTCIAIVGFSLTASLFAAPQPGKGQGAAEVKLSGIIALPETKKVMLHIQEPARPGQAASTRMGTLKEGDSIGAVRVLQINEAAGLVKIDNAGKEMELSMAKDAVPPPTLPVVQSLPKPVPQSPKPAALAPRVRLAPASQPAPLPTPQSEVIVIGRSAQRRSGQEVGTTRRTDTDLRPPRFGGRRSRPSNPAPDVSPPRVAQSPAFGNAQPVPGEQSRFLEVQRMEPLPRPTQPIFGQRPVPGSFGPPSSSASFSRVGSSSVGSSSVGSSSAVMIHSQPFDGQVLRRSEAVTIQRPLQPQ